MAQGRHYASGADDARRRRARKARSAAASSQAKPAAEQPTQLRRVPADLSTEPPRTSGSAPAPLQPSASPYAEASTFDPETGAHVTTQVPLDNARFGRAWVDPDPEPLVSLPHQYDSDGGGHYVPGEGKSRSVWRPVLAILLIAALVGGTAAFVTYGLELWGGRSVPPVIGVSESNAVAALEKRGFAVEVRQRAVDDAIGFVVETDPAAGARVKGGSTVTIYVGVARTIPQVIGLTEADARRALIEAGATELEVSYQSSDAPEGTVIAVSPGEGERFTSRDVVTFTVAQPFTVPDVVGKIESVAEEQVRAQGLSPTVVSVPSDEVAGTVVETDPPAGTRLEAGATVELRVASALPTDPLRLAKYFGAVPSEVADYLADRGFSLEAGRTGEAGEAEARFVSSELGTLTFSDEPFSPALPAGATAGNNPLATGAAIRGVRWDAAASQLPGGESLVTNGTVTAMMERCGLKGERDSCNQDSIILPEGTARRGDLRFICTYGELNGFAWTVLVVGGGVPRVSVTCAPKALYDDFDLAGFGGQVCSMVAYANVYAG